MGGNNDFKSIWSYLKFITTKSGNTPSDECAIKAYGKYLKHDHRNIVLMSKDGTHPEGWICPNNPFKIDCKFTPLRNLKDQFIKWTYLLNNGRDDLAYSKQEIVRDSIHWKLQNDHNWNFALPNRDDPNFKSKLKKFIQNMNQYAGDIILEIRSKGRTKSSIHKELINLYENKNNEEQLLNKSLKQNATFNYRKPLLFTIEKRIEKVILPFSSTNAKEIEYLIKNYKKEQKEFLMKISSVSDEEKEILKKHKLKNKQSQISKNEQKYFSGQVSLLAKKVGESLDRVAKNLNLCGNNLVFTSRYSISDKVSKRRTNHFNFSTSICTDTNLFMRQFNVKPLFNGWSNSKSINSKIFTIDTKAKFIKEYKDPSPDSPDYLKLKLSKKIDYADNDPLIFSLTTGKNMTKNFMKSISNNYQSTQDYNSTLLNENNDNKNNFHKCIVNEIKYYIKSHHLENGKIEGAKSFPVSVKSNIVKIKNRNGRIKTFWGIGVDWGILPTDFYSGHIGTIFNYNDKNKLNSLESFLVHGFAMQNKALRICLSKSKK